MHTRPRIDEDDAVIGADRDADALAEQLCTGHSVVLAGPRGSGKSFLLRAVVRALRRRGTEPVRIQPVAHLAGTPGGALDAVARDAVARLRAGSSEQERPLFVIDDAHELDSDTADALFAAVYAHRATVLLTLTARRHGAPGAAPDPRSTAQRIVDLWLNGSARRLDLSTLQPADAHALVDLLPDSHLLDAVARASVIWRANGSRLLLRELGSAAIAGARCGRDPLRALHHPVPQNRQADALMSYVQDFDDDVRSALLLVDRAPGIAAADAARFLPERVIDLLVARRILHVDRSVFRRLTANRSLAWAVGQQWGADRAHAGILAALARFIADDGAWWSDPLALALAGHWLRSDDRVEGMSDVSTHMRDRVLIAAARAMNDHGDPSVALAYVSLAPPDAPAVGLRTEEAYARVLLGSEPSTPPPRPEDLDADGWERTLHIHRALALRGRRSAAGRFPAPPDVQDPTSAANTIVRAVRAALDLRWDAALTQLDAALEDERLTGLDRIRIEAATAMCCANLGRWDRARRTFARVDRGMSDPTAPPVPTALRLIVLTVELSAALLVGERIPRTLERARAEIDYAARESTPEVRALAGFTAALCALHAGEPQVARREIRAAVARAEVIPAGPTAVLAQVATAHALALTGATEEARCVLPSVDAPRHEFAYMAHAAASLTSVLCTAEGDRPAAQAAARRAADLTRDSAAVVQHGRDLFRLAVLSGDPADLARLDRLAAEQPLRLFRSLATLARTADRRDPGDAPHPREALRLSGPTLVEDDPRQPSPPHPSAGPHRSATARPLTRRERETARLVAEGLSNREIAQRLFLSVRTVESHVYQARTKLGVRTRRELGDAIRRDGGEDEE